MARTPLGKVRGLGAARSGTEHFWMQIVTSVASIPLTIFFIGLVLSLVGRPWAEAVAVLGHPIVAILLSLFVLTNVEHMRIGMQVVIEDYVHSDLPKAVLLMLNTFYSYGLGFAALFAIAKLSFGS
jgi:succinate dehydrogenase / fumarate reductase, membrane anchor subunit